MNIREMADCLECLPCEFVPKFKGILYLLKIVIPLCRISAK